MSSSDPVTVIGGGLAGCEVSWQLARRGIPVRLVEMKPAERSPAHSQDGLAELVCSNSFRGAAVTSAVGLLKQELERLGSLLMCCAAETAVPAGRALAVDRVAFSRAVEDRLAAHDRIAIERGRWDDLDGAGDIVVATGPLTDGALLRSLERHGASLSYHDAIAPLIAADSVDMDLVFRASRYEDPALDGAYLNCPLAQEEYLAFVRELVAADKTPLWDFEQAPFFEGCLPLEEMAARGPLTLAHGPLKPVGLVDPRSGRRPFAVVQLRQEDRAGSAYSLVGFQTRLTRPEQRRVLRMVPGLEQAVFERYGQVHRNTFLDAPAVLDDQMRLRGNPAVRVAGQLTGVEGYVESIASGLYVGLALAAARLDLALGLPPAATAIGGLMRHTRGAVGKFQPSNVVWAMIDAPQRQRGQKKRDHRRAAAGAALEALDGWMAEHSSLFEI
jgi:methylenetetrahydrofolate--tRNA-(uracil-5-)-methyltransferase